MAGEHGKGCPPEMERFAILNGSMPSTAGVPIGVPPEAKGAILPVTNLSIPGAERFSQGLMGRFLCFAPMRLHDASKSVQIVPNLPFLS
jgi:hypothetical protein